MIVTLVVHALVTCVATRTPRVFAVECNVRNRESVAKCMKEAKHISSKYSSEGKVHFLVPTATSTATATDTDT